MRKYRDMGIRCRIAVMVLFVVAVTVGAVRADAAPEKRKVTIGVHFSSGAGLNAAESFDYTTSIARILSTETGYDFTIVKFPTWEEVQAAVKRGEVDSAYMYVGLIVELLYEGADVEPFLSYSVGGEKRESMCLWQRKDDTATNVQSADGRRFLSQQYDTYSLVMLRNYFKDQGVDKPLWKIFKSFTIVPNSNSAFMALAMGDGDYYWISRDYDTILKLINPSIKPSLKNNLCTDKNYARGGIVVNTKKISKKDMDDMRAKTMEFIKNITKHAKNDQAIMMMRQYMMMADGKILPVRRQDYENDVEILRRAKKQGWVEESKLIMSSMKGAQFGKDVSIKADRAFCEKECGKSNFECILGCIE